MREHNDGDSLAPAAAGSRTTCTAGTLSPKYAGGEIGELLESQLPSVGTSHEPGVLVHQRPILLSNPYLLLVVSRCSSLNLSPLSHRAYHSGSTPQLLIGFGGQVEPRSSQPEELRITECKLEHGSAVCRLKNTVLNLSARPSRRFIHITCQLPQLNMGSDAQPTAPSQCLGPEYRPSTQRPTATVSTPLKQENVHILPQTPQLIALLT